MTNIRHFMDLVSGSLPEARELKSNLLLSLLEEGRADQYRQMMEPLSILAAGDDAARKTIDDYLNLALSLKRDDRIVWAIKLLRAKFVHDWDSRRGAEATPKQLAVINKLSIPTTENSTVFKQATRSINLIKSHYLAIPFAKIQQYVFPANAPPDEIIKALEGFEHEFKERTKGLVTQQEGDEIILKFADGMCWMKLSRGGCAQEAAAMGHCGNGSGSPGQNILSLRQMRVEAEGVKYYEPFLTFIREADGRLGEMKGKNNDKPIPKYHPYIIALLKLPLITGIKGGGYLPQNNFSLSDLTTEQRDSLLAVKPELGGFAYLLKRQGLTDEVKRMFNEEAEKFDGPVTLYEAYIQWEVASSWEDLCVKYGDDKLRYWAEVILGGGYIHVEADTSDRGKERVIDNLPGYAIASLRKRMDDLMAEHGPNDEDEYYSGIDWDDRYESRTIVKIADEYDDDLNDALINACQEGEERGVEKEAYEAVVKAIKEPDLRMGTMDVGENIGDSVFVTLTPMEFTTLINEFEEDDKYSIGFARVLEYEEIRIDEPRYGFSGYSAESASNRFIEEWLNVAPIPHFDLGSEAEIEQATEELNEKLVEVGMKRSRAYSNKTTPMDVFKDAYKRYFGKDWDEQENERRRLAT